jgi:ferrous iron transport protein B
VKPPERPDTFTGKGRRRAAASDRGPRHPADPAVRDVPGGVHLGHRAGTPSTRLQGWLPGSANHLPRGLLRSFIADGLIAGVGSVLVFLPQILILFFFILLLEDSGYMARAAFLMDKIMGGAGLHGRAFIPLLSSFACAIPGIMSTRVIDNKHDRLTTILVAPLMTCSARIPVYTLIIGAFIPHGRPCGASVNLQGLVMFGLYAAGIVSALAVSFVIRRVFWRGAVEPFMMELPTYRWPEPRTC